MGIEEIPESAKGASLIFSKAIQVGFNPKGLKCLRKAAKNVEPMILLLFQENDYGEVIKLARTRNFL